MYALKEVETNNTAWVRVVCKAKLKTAKNKTTKLSSFRKNTFCIQMGEAEEVAEVSGGNVSTD